MNRRQFLSLAAVTAASTCAPSLFAADTPLILGQGAHRYECLHDWGTLPPDIVYGITHGIAVDKTGNVHVQHTSRKDSPTKDTLVVFNPDGKFLRSWGAQFVGSAHGLDLITEDNRELLYITDMARGLFKTTLDGKILWHLQKPPFYSKPNNKTKKYTPTNVAVAPDGTVFLADGYGSWYIHILDKNGNYKSTFGGPDGAIDKPSPNATIHPHGLHIDTHGKEPLLVVAENDPNGRKPGRLHAFNLAGRHPLLPPPKLRSPRHFDRHHDLTVIPDLDATVTLLNPDHEIIAQLGDGFTTFEQVRPLRSKPRTQFTPGQFICPHDAAFAPDGSLFIAEWVDVGRITKLRKLPV